MARDRRPPNPKYQSDCDLGRFIPQMEDYLAGKRPKVTAGEVREISIPELCTFMEALLLQLPKRFPRGSVEALREHVRDVSKYCYANSLASKCELRLLENMKLTGDIDDVAFERWKRASESCAEKVFRATVQFVTDLHSMIQTTCEKRPAHRPEGSLAAPLVASDRKVLDRAILKAAANYTADDGTLRLSFNMSAVMEKLRESIREATQDGVLPRRGSTPKENIDAHARRIRRKIYPQANGADKKSEALRR
jgi:hypothetical protein